MKPSLPDPVETVITTLLSDFEHSLDQGDYHPLVKVTPSVRYTDKKVKSFIVTLKNGVKVEVSGKRIK